MTTSQNLECYLKEIARTPLLKREEEVELAARIRRGEEEALDHLIRANLRLVVKIAGDYDKYGLPLEDLVAEGNTGLMKAAERFDPEQGKFSTYAAFWIKQAIRRALANQSRTVRLPVHAVEKLGKIRRAAARLEERHGREATPEEIAAVTGMPRDKVSLMLDAAARPVSIDAPAGDDDSNSTLGDVVADVAAEMPGEELGHVELLNRMNDLLGLLDVREQRIIRRRYGLDQRQPETLEEIGHDLGVTRERIRQLQNIALRKMRKALRTLEAPSLPQVVAEPFVRAAARPAPEGSAAA